MHYATRTPAGCKVIDACLDMRRVQMFPLPALSIKHAAAGSFCQLANYWITNLDDNLATTATILAPELFKPWSCSNHNGSFRRLDQPKRTFEQIFYQREPTANANRSETHSLSIGFWQRNGHQFEKSHDVIKSGHELGNWPLLAL